MNPAFWAVMAGVLARAPVSSPSFGSKEGSPCVLMDLCGGVWPLGSGSAEKTQHKVIAGQALMHILKYLTVLIAFAFSPSYFPYQSVK